MGIECCARCKTYFCDSCELDYIYNASEYSEDDFDAILEEFDDVLDEYNADMDSGVCNMCAKEVQEFIDKRKGRDLC